MIPKATVTVLLLAVLVSCGRSESNSKVDIPDELVTLCGDPALVGLPIPDIEKENSPCGVEDPVEIHFVSGVALNPRPQVTCNTAVALREWVDDAAQPAVDKLGTEITRIRVAAHYSCRTRNSQAGARLSEHAKGNAIDIGAMTLANGDVLSVEDHWRDSRLGAVLKTMYKNACGIFQTTLGPDSDRYHQDHFHFDVAQYRSGAYCR